MEYRYLGRTGVQVSEVGLGTMTFGNEADEATSRAILDRAFEQGVNLFDSAQSYNNGESERIVGRWLGRRRPEVVLASKAYFPYGGGINDARLSRRNLVRSVEASLKAFQTDYLDLLYLHHWDDTSDLREPLGTLNTLIQQGKVLYGAISNFSAWQVMKALSVADAVVTERDTGEPTNAVFVVSLSAVSGRDVTAQYATARARPRKARTTRRCRAASRFRREPRRWRFRSRCWATRWTRGTKLSR